MTHVTNGRGYARIYPSRKGLDVHARCCICAAIGITIVKTECELLFITFNCIILVGKISTYQGRALLHWSHLLLSQEGTFSHIDFNIYQGCTSTISPSYLVFYSLDCAKSNVSTGPFFTALPAVPPFQRLFEHLDIYPRSASPRLCPPPSSQESKLAGVPIS